MLTPAQVSALALLLRGPLPADVDLHGLPDLVKLDGGEWHVRDRIVVRALVNAARQAEAMAIVSAAKAAIRWALDGRM